jgi:transposase-like protein
MAQRLDASKQTRWLDLIQRWQRQRSQLTVREFCQRHHISEASFFSWRRVLRQRGLLDEPMAPAADAAPPFITLVTPVTPPRASTIEVVLTKQRRLRVRPGFDADMLRELVRLLEDPSC